MGCRAWISGVDTAGEFKLEFQRFSRETVANPFRSKQPIPRSPPQQLNCSPFPPPSQRCKLPGKLHAARRAQTMLGSGA